MKGERVILFFLFVMEKSEKFGKSRESQIRREFLKRIKRGYDEEPEKIRKLSEGTLRATQISTAQGGAP